jgi:hypothetical protein
MPRLFSRSSSVAAGQMLILAAMALLALALVIASALAPGGRPVVKITGIDTVAYYGTARSILFDQDFDLRNEFQVLKPIPSHWNATVPQTGLPGAPFPIGFPVLELPFLSAGAAMEYFFAPSVSGYSTYSMHAWFFGVLFYTGCGLMLTLALLRDVARSIGLRGEVSDPACVLATLLLWPATTLGYYSLSPVPHAVSFFIVSACMWAWWQAKATDSWARWLRFGLAAGLMFLCRWQDALILLLPIGWELNRWLREGPTCFSPAYWRSRLGAAALMLVLMALQTLQWHQVYGHWVTIPQGGDFLQWPPRHILQVLFSTQHGWIAWTPIAALALAGLATGLRKAPLLMGLIALAMLAEITLIGAVATWHADRSFGMRYLTSLSPFLGLGLMLLFSLSTSKPLRYTIRTLAIACAAFSLLFAMQYRLDLIPENQPLSFREYLVDKIKVREAMARRRSVQQGEQALQARNPQAAWDASLDGAQRFGDNAALIGVAQQAAEDAGSADWRAHVLERQATYQRSLMY